MDATLTALPIFFPPWSSFRSAAVAFFTAISVLIVVVSKETGYQLSVNTVMLSVLSTMIS